MSHHLVETIDLCFSYPDSPPALNGVSLRITHGESVAVVGGNGAGKSTLLLHLNGLLTPSSGQVRVGDIPVTPKTVARVRESVGMVFQQAEDQLFMPTVREDVAFGPLNMGLPPEEIRRRVEQALRDVHAEALADKMTHHLSGGEKRAVSIATVLSMSPDILVLDEPVDGLDPVMRRQVWSLLMGDVADHGTTVLVSSHNLRELEDVCDHVGILSRGKVLIERSLSALQENVVKMQVVFQEKELPQLPGDLQVLHVSQVGRIHTLIIRGNATEITNRLAAFAPILMEALPLTLEEIFIYELGGADYAVKDIVL